MAKLADASLEELYAERNKRQGLVTPVADVQHQVQPGLRPSEPAEVVEQPKTSLFRRAVADPAISALKGAISVPEAAVGLLDIPTFGYAGKAAEAAGFEPKFAKTVLESLYSPAQKEANRRVAEAKGFGETAATMITNPSTIAHGVIEALPVMGAGGAVAQGVRAGLGVGVLAASAVGEGLVGAGLSAEQLRQESETGLLDKKDAAIAIASGLGTSIFNLVGGRVANKLGIADVDTLLAGGARKQTSKSIARKIVEGGISEGVFEELPQTIQETMWMNVAQDKPLLEGVPEASAQAILIGGAMGGGANISIPDRRGGVSPSVEMNSMMALRKANLTDKQLDTLSANPELLAEHSVDKNDIDALRIERVLDDEEQNRFQTILSSAPNDAVKRGILDSLQGEVFLRRGQLKEDRVKKEPKVKTETEKAVEAFTKPVMTDKEIEKVMDAEEYPISTEAQDQLDVYADDLIADKVPFAELKVTRTETINNLEASLVNLEAAETPEVMNLASEAVEINRRQLDILDSIISPEAKPLKFGEVPKDVGIQEVDSKIEAEVEDQIDRGEDRRVDASLQDVDFERRKADRREAADLMISKRVSQMSREELEVEALIRPLTQMPNRRAYEESVLDDIDADVESATVFMDVDSLAFVNDNSGGHTAGDTLLKTIGSVIKEIGGEKAFHISGDEFIMKADTTEEAQVLADKVSEALKNKEMVLTLENGEKHIYDGLGVSYGIAKTRQEADDRMAAHKIKREEAGLRSERKTAPPGFRRVPARKGKERRDTGQEVQVTLSETAKVSPIGKLVGRKTASDIVNPDTNEVVVAKGANLTVADINALSEIGYTNVPVTTGKAKKVTAKKEVKKAEPKVPTKKPKKKVKKAELEVPTKQAKKEARKELVQARREAKKEVKPSKKEVKKVKSEKTVQIEKELDEELLLYNREGLIEVHEELVDLPDDAIEALEREDDPSELMFSKDGDTVVGLYYKGKIHLIASKIAAVKDVKGLVVHEGGHFLRRQDSWFQKNYDSLFDQFVAIAEGSRTSGEAKAAQSAVEKALSLGEHITADLIQEEAFMYFLQNQANTKYGLFRETIDLVKRWIFKVFKWSVVQMNISGRDMSNMLVKDIRESLANNSFIEPVEFDVPLASKLDKAKDSSEEARKLLEDIFRPDNFVKEDPDTFTRDTAKRVAKEHKDSFTKKFAVLTDSILSQTEDNPDDFRRGENEQTSHWYERLFSSPEYYFRKDATASRVLYHAQAANDHQFEWEHKILDNFIDVAEGFKKDNRKAYIKANKYILEVDQTGKGFSLQPSEDEGWDVLDRDNEIIKTYKIEQEAVDAMIVAEQQYLVTKWFSKDARALIRATRELANRGFDVSIADMRRQIDNALENDQPEPIIKYRGDEGKLNEISLSEAISKMGDLRGTYFPRERQNKKYILRGEKEGQPNELHTYDLLALPNEMGVDTIEGIKKYFNKFTPVGKKVRELQKRGYTTSVKLAPTPSDVIFDVPGLLTSMDSILSAAESQLRTDEDIQEEEAKLLGEINKQLTTRIADIYKAKSNFSSRKKRAESLWVGYEEDLSKAFTSYSRRVAAGAAKRETARRMLMSFTGRDIPFKRWQERFPNGTYSDYRAFVKDRAIDPTTQKNLYDDVRQYMTHVIKPDTRATRVIGYLKALAVLKFLALRVSSAAVNMTNMAAAVPATIAGHTGQSLTKSWGDITVAATKYGLYRVNRMRHATDDAPVLTGTLSEDDKWLFDRISELGWDEAQFNHDAAQVINDWAGDTWNSIMSAGMYMFGATEKANRAMTIFASYKAFERTRPGLNPEQVLKLAKHASDRAHGTYGKTAKPWWVQKYPPLDLLFTFQKFQQNYALNALELGMSKKDWKSSSYMLLAPGVLAGLGSSILTKILAAVWWGGGDDPEEDFYNWVDELVGEGGFISRFARHGIAGAVFGVNLKGSLQMNNPFPTKLEEFAGATGGIAKDMYNGSAHLRRGEYTKALEDFSPTAIGAALKGRREKREGITTKGYAPVYYGSVPLRANSTEQALRYFSFNPTRISGVREKQWKEEQVRREYSKDRSDISAKILHHYAQYGHANPEGLGRVLKEIDEYNDRVYRSHPRYQNIYIDNNWLKGTLRRAYKPSKVERQRKIN